MYVGTFQRCVLQSTLYRWIKVRGFGVGGSRARRSRALIGWRPRIFQIARTCPAANPISWERAHMAGMGCHALANSDQR